MAIKKIPITHLAQTLMEVHGLCGEIGVTFAQIKSKRRTDRIARARWRVWRYLVDVRGYTLADAGKITGGHDHSTVWHGLRRLKEIENDGK